MKKFASLLLAVALLATMLSVFAVSASAEETKTAEDYLSEAAQLENARQYNEAVTAYKNAAELYEEADDLVSAINMYIKAGAAYMKYADECSDSAGPFTQAGNSYLKACDYAAAANAYMKAGECFLKNGNFSDAGDCFYDAAQAARRKANESTGSTLSEGSLTIIVGVACSVVFLAVGFFIGTKKKKKPALASGENTDEE